MRRPALAFLGPLALAVLAGCGPAGPVAPPAPTLPAPGGTYLLTARPEQAPVGSLVLTVTGRRATATLKEGGTTREFVGTVSLYDRSWHVGVALTRGEGERCGGALLPVEALGLDFGASAEGDAELFTPRCDRDRVRRDDRRFYRLRR